MIPNSFTGKQRQEWQLASLRTQSSYQNWKQNSAFPEHGIWTAASNTAFITLSQTFGKTSIPRYTFHQALATVAYPSLILNVGAEWTALHTPCIQTLPFFPTSPAKRTAEYNHFDSYPMLGGYAAGKHDFITHWKMSKLWTEKEI